MRDFSAAPLSNKAQPRNLRLDLAFEVHRPGRVRVQVIAGYRCRPLTLYAPDRLVIPCGDDMIALVTLGLPPLSS